MSMNELGHYVKSLKEGGHVCLIFENEDQKWDLEAEYVKRALEQGYRAYVATMKEDEQEARSALNERGIDMDASIKDGSLAMAVFTPADAKNPQVEGNPFFEVKAGKTLVDELLRSGKKGMYMASNAGTFFLRHGYLDQLFKLESLAHRQLENKLPFGYLCCYDVSDLAPTERPLALKELLEHYRRISEQNPQLMHSHNIAIYVSREGGVLAQLPV